MLNKDLFCRVVNSLKHQAQKMSKLEEALDQPIEWFWVSQEEVLRALETQCCLQWSDEIWELIFDSGTPAEAIYAQLKDLLKDPYIHHKAPIFVEDLIDDYFSHNEIISLNVVMQEEDGCPYYQKIWRGEAWKLEEDHPEYLKYKFIRFHEVVPESITKSDLFIEVSQS